jgi:hypothetical protein
MIVMNGLIEFNKTNTQKNNAYSRRIIFAFLFLVFIHSFVYAQAQPVTLRTVPWELTVLAVLLVQVTIIVIAYMVSSAFNIKELAGWSKGEVYQVAIMAFIVFLFFSLIKVENIVFEAYGFTPSQSDSNPAIENARLYLDSVRTYSLAIFTSVQTSLIVLNFIHAQGENIKIPYFEFKDTAEEAVKSISGLLMIINISAASVLGLTTLQYYFLDIIERLAFTVILPFGLLFRMFSFTRSVGNFLIVVAISFYIVYPLTFLMNQTIVDTLLNKQGGWQDILGERKLQNSKFVQFLSGVNSITENDTAISEILNSVTSVISSINKYINPFNILDEAAFGFILFTVIPILDFTITIVVAKELGSLFGSDVSFTDLLKQL